MLKVGFTLILVARRSLSGNLYLAPILTLAKKASLLIYVIAKPYQYETT